MLFEPVIENLMLHCKNWRKTTAKNSHSMLYVQQKPISNALNGERTQCDRFWLDRLVSPLEHVQKIKYDNIKFISIPLSCPGEIRYLPFYSLLLKRLTNWILIFYIVLQMKVYFWLCKFFVLAQAHWSACSREVSTRSFSVPSYQHNIPLFFQNLRIFWTIFCSTVKQNSSQVLLATAISPYVRDMKSEVLLTFPVWVSEFKPKSFNLQHNTPAVKAQPMAMCVCTHPWQAWKGGDITLLPFILYFPWTKLENNSGSHSLWTGLFEGEKPPKETKTIAIKLLKAPGFNLQNQTALLVCS